MIHESVYDEVVERLQKAYSTVPIGDPLDEATLMGPLHSEAGVKQYETGLEAIVAQVRIGHLLLRYNACPVVVWGFDSVSLLCWCPSVWIVSPTGG